MSKTRTGTCDYRKERRLTKTKISVCKDSMLLDKQITDALLESIFSLQMAEREADVARVK